MTTTTFSQDARPSLVARLLNFIAGIISLLSILAVLGLSLAVWLNLPPLLVLYAVSLVVAALSTAYGARAKALVNQRKLHQKIALQEVGDEEVDAEDRRQAELVIPPLLLLVKRNLWVAFFTGLVLLIISALDIGYFLLVREFGRSHPDHLSTVNALIIIAFVMHMTAWVAIGVSISFTTKFVDQHILKQTTELPLDEETLSKRKLQQWLSPPGEPKKNNINFVQTALTILSSLGGLVLIFVPSLLAAALTDALNLPDTTSQILVIVTGIIFPMAFLIHNMNTISRRLNRNYVRSLEEELRKTQDSSEQEAFKAEIARAQQTEAKSEHSLEGRVGRRVVIVFVGGMGLLLLIALLVRIALRNAGISNTNSDNVSALILFIGMIVVFGLVYFGVRLYVPKSKAQALLAQIEPLIRQGRYDEATVAVEVALKELPNWETYAPAAMVYGTMGRFDEAQKYILALRREGSDGITGYNTDLKKSFLGLSFILKAHIDLFQGDVDAAEAELIRASALSPEKTFAECNLTAHLHLLRGNATEAMAAITAAEASYHANKKPVSAYNRALKAWALALDGQDADAEALMTATIASVPPADRVDLAEVYLMGGYMARARRKPSAERHAFEKAIALDPKGACGMVARRELASTTE